MSGNRLKKTWTDKYRFRIEKRLLVHSMEYIFIVDVHGVLLPLMYPAAPVKSVPCRTAHDCATTRMSDAAGNGRNHLVKHQTIIFEIN